MTTTLRKMMRTSGAPVVQPKKVKIRLSSVGGLTRQNVEAYYYEDGRAFVTEAGWLRLHHSDPRISKAALVEIRGTIDVPVKTVGVIFRSQKRIGPRVEVTMERQDGSWRFTGRLRDGSLERTCEGSGSIHAARRLAQSMLADPSVGRESENTSTVPFICRMCGGTGRIDIGSCNEIRCVEQRQTQAAGRRLFKN